MDHTVLPTGVCTFLNSKYNKVICSPVPFEVCVGGTRGRGRGRKKGEGKKGEGKKGEGKKGERKKGEGKKGEGEREGEGSLMNTVCVPMGQFTRSHKVPVGCFHRRTGREKSKGNKHIILPH